MVSGIIGFLKLLRENNNREWFNDNKHLYLEAKEQFDDLIPYLIDVFKAMKPLKDFLNRPLAG